MCVKTALCFGAVRYMHGNSIRIWFIKDENGGITLK